MTEGIDWDSLDDASGLGHYDRAGKRITLRQWGELKYQDPDYHRVALTIVGEAKVSTVWLGLDHRMTVLDGGGPPIIFETMIFGGPHDEEQWRYSTEVEARAGHELVVAQLREEEEQERE
jgi:hypothetical protein